MGFEEDVNYILDSMPVNNMKPDTDEAEDIEYYRKKIGLDCKYRQTVMFSATMPPLVEKLAKKYLRRPAMVIVGQVGQAVDKIEQIVEFISDENKKRERLYEILQRYKAPILIFTNHKRT